MIPLIEDTREVRTKGMKNKLAAAQRLGESGGLMRRPALGETRERDCQAALPLGCEVIARLHGLITPHITAH